MTEEEKSVKVLDYKKKAGRILKYVKYTCPRCKHWFTLS